MIKGIELRVARVDEAAAGIRSFRLRRDDGGVLPSFVPGSHVLVECDDRRNAYSLTGDGTFPTEYSISVLLCPAGAGGSAFMHRVNVGDRLWVSRPRSAFAPITTARRHLLIAGGIGVTPMLSHVRAAVRWGREFEFLYGYRPGADAHLTELETLCGPRLRSFAAIGDMVTAVESALVAQPLGTHVYVCGPAPLIELVQTRAGSAGWPPHRVHVERFSAPDIDPGEPFAVRLARSRTRVLVPSGTSLLEALERAGQQVSYLCRQGVCGECRVTVLSGRPLHRDLYLSEQERIAADSVMSCVSRSVDGELELDL